MSAAAGLLLGGFTECRGLESWLDFETYLEGGVNDRVHRFPTRMAYSNITLVRGVGFGEDLWLWHEEFQKGEGTRRDGLIILQDNFGAAESRPGRFSNGLPIKWTGPAFNARRKRGRDRKPRDRPREAGPDRVTRQAARRCLAVLRRIEAWPVKINELDAEVHAFDATALRDRRGAADRAGATAERGDGPACTLPRRDGCATRRLARTDGREE